MKRTIKGTVISDKNDKTVVVLVNTYKTHPIYRKKYTVSQKFMAHDESNKVKIGDTVEIEESRPLSARKRWVVVSAPHKSTDLRGPQNSPQESADSRGPQKAHQESKNSSAKGKSSKKQDGEKK